MLPAMRQSQGTVGRISKEERRYGHIGGIERKIPHCSRRIRAGCGGWRLAYEAKEKMMHGMICGWCEAGSIGGMSLIALRI